MIRQWQIHRQQKKAFVRDMEQVQNYFVQQKKWSQKKKVLDSHFVVLDTETTGLDAKKDRILSVGAVPVENLKMNLASHHDVILQQKKDFSGDSISVHGILPVETTVGITEKEYFPHFLTLIQDAVIVGHHVAFDYAILSRYVKEQFGFSLTNRMLDTHRLAIRAEQGSSAKDSLQISQQKYTLDALCQRYDIEPLDRHTAAGDAFLTALLFLKLVKKMKLNNSLLRDLL